MLANFGFSKIYFSDSAQCWPILDFRKFIFLSLRSVSLYAESLISRKIIFKANHVNLFISGPDGFDS